MCIFVNWSARQPPWSSELLSSLRHCSGKTTLHSSATFRATLLGKTRYAGRNDSLHNAYLPIGNAGGASFRHKHSTGPASFSSAVAMGDARSSAAERLAGHPAAAAAPAAACTSPTMGIVGSGVGRAVGKGLTAAALATVGSWPSVGVAYRFPLGLRRQLKAAMALVGRFPPRYIKTFNWFHGLVRPERKQAAMVVVRCTYPATASLSLSLGLQPLFASSHGLFLLLLLCRGSLTPLLPCLSLPNFALISSIFRENYCDCVV